MALDVWWHWPGWFPRSHESLTASFWWKCAHAFIWNYKALAGLERADLIPKNFLFQGFTRCTYFYVGALVRAQGVLLSWPSENVMTQHVPPQFPQPKLSSTVKSSLTSTRRNQIKLGTEPSDRLCGDQPPCRLFSCIPSFTSAGNTFWANSCVPAPHDRTEQEWSWPGLTLKSWCLARRFLVCVFLL